MPTLVKRTPKPDPLSAFPPAQREQLLAWQEMRDRRIDERIDERFALIAQVARDVTQGVGAAFAALRRWPDGK